MGSDAVLVFGAGATKACGGPLTNEILPETFRNITCLPLLLSMLDLALNIRSFTLSIS